MEFMKRLRSCFRQPAEGRAAYFELILERAECREWLDAIDDEVTARRSARMLSLALETPVLVYRVTAPNEGARCARYESGRLVN